MTAPPLIPRSDLPAGWKWTKLRDAISDLRPGFACGERDTTGVVQVRMHNVSTDGSFNWGELIRVPSSYTDMSKYWVEPGDVLFNNTNSVELVGKSTIFSGFTEPIVFSNHFSRLRTDPGALEADFLAKWLVLSWQQGLFASICNRWVGQAAVDRHKLLELTIPLPPLAEQKRIVGILSEQLATVERAKRAADERLEAARALQESFRLRLFQPATIQEWATHQLLELCEGKGQYGTSRKSNGNALGVPVLGMGNIRDGKVTWVDVKHIDLAVAERNKFQLLRGDLLFNRTNSAELVGKSAVYDGCQTAVFASYLVRFKLHADRADPRFICAYINSSLGRSFVRDHLTRAIGQANISASTMHNMPVPTPSLREQIQLSNALDEFDREISRLELAIAGSQQVLASMQSTLLRRAFSGEI